MVKASCEAITAWEVTCTLSERQFYDAAGVFAVQGAVLDMDYLKSWAEKHQEYETLEDLITGKLRRKTT